MGITSERQFNRKLKFSVNLNANIHSKLNFFLLGNKVFYPQKFLSVKNKTCQNYLI